MVTGGGRVLWLHGPAGAGKSTIAQTVSEECAWTRQLVGSFFFSRTTAGHDIAKSFFPTIALQLAARSPRLRHFIASAIKRDPLIFDKSLATQGRCLLVRPFYDLLISAHYEHDLPFLIILDGLDECNDRNSQCAILDCIAEALHIHQLPLCFVVVSCPEPHIKEAFRSGNFCSGILEEQSLYLHCEGSFEARRDVHAFMVKEFARVYDSEKHRDFMKSVSKPWPRPDDVDILVDRSDGSFIYVAMVVHFVDEEYYSPVDRLDEIMAALGSSPSAEIDKLYIQILSTSPNTALLMRILGALLIDLPSAEYAVDIRNPEIIEHIFDLKKGAVHSALRGMHSLLRVLDNTVELYHASSYDFLLDRDRAGQYFIDPAEHHADVALNVLRRDHKLIPVRIYSGWSFHASKASYPSKILAQLEVLPKNHWESFCDEIDSGIAFLSVAYMSGTAIKWLELVAEGREDLLNQMIYLLNRAFRELVVKEHDDDVIIIQGLHNKLPFDAAKPPVDLHRLWLLDLTEFFGQFSDDGKSSLIPPLLTKVRAVEQASGYQHFETFVKNPVYSEGVLASPGACHALLASCCMDLAACIQRYLKTNPYDRLQR
ncbi:hypothetical protein D9615_006918 [Tricholomella constricta]|uniref:Nephrocystin 3-like N-terminal domain-containing protein n=1 Tax=Tricholomella constricta TaxID=117010 RepID=A0A8H5M2T5_9AGAR|nr:hypothetical protein D9615_006918 [Tricholomella constricta]